MHLHTEYSYDGNYTLSDIAGLAKKHGHSFILLTEHNDDFNDDKMKRFVSACKHFSSDSMLIIPGLEVNCDFGRHILALGVTRRIETASPDHVVESIKENGGLAIIPHPCLYQFRSFLASAENLNGVEVWNSRYDGTWAPNPRSFSLLRRLRHENPNIFAYAGQDAHSLSDVSDLRVTMELESITEYEILFSLARGRFTVGKRKTLFDAGGTMTRTQKAFFEIAAAAALARNFLTRTRKNQ